MIKIIKIENCIRRIVVRSRREELGGKTTLPKESSFDHGILFRYIHKIFDNGGARVRMINRRTFETWHHAQLTCRSSAKSYGPLFTDRFFRAGTRRAGKWSTFPSPPSPLLSLAIVSSRDSSSDGLSSMDLSRLDGLSHTNPADSRTLISARHPIDVTLYPS